MLPLKKLAELAQIEEKTIFPYKILNKKLKKYIKIEPSIFENINDYNLFIKENNITEKNVNIYNILEKYCKNDALITKKSILMFWKIIEDNGLKNNNRMLTAAKISIENYFIKNNIVKKKIKIEFDRILRENYFGGRTEVFGNLFEDEVALHFDWTGMYAECMCEKVLGGEINKSEKIISLDIPGFYWITFKQNLEIPILPIKKDKLMFVNGTFSGWYWFEEILLAIKYGVNIISVDKTIYGQYYDFFLKEFVNINNEIRKISPLHKLIGKNNNNTFYGRLGMNPERMEEEITNDINSLEKYEKIVKKNDIYIGYKKKEKSISNISISSSITSKGRIKLYEGMQKVIKEGGRILYTDTDSIVAAFKKNIYKDKLDINIGEVFFNSKKEDTIILDAVFAMPKTYGIKYKNGKEIVKIKGFNTKPNFDEFKDAFYSKKEIYTLNNQWNKKDFIIKKEEKMKKTNLNSLDKRKWKKNLKETEPIYIND